MAVRAIKHGQGLTEDPLWYRTKKVSLLIGTALVSINIWTGGPLLALWVGSKAQGGDGLSMAAVFVVILTLAVVVFAFATALAWLNARYEQLMGIPQRTREAYPWLRSLSAEREREVKRARGVNAAERAVILSVVAAVLAFEIWFFFFAQYAFPGA